MELARQFGVHRGTVREALRELETNGVLKRERGSKLMMVTRPTRGAVAAGVSARPDPARRELPRRLGGADRARTADRRRRGARVAASRKDLARLERPRRQRGGRGSDRGVLPCRRRGHAQRRVHARARADWSSCWCPRWPPLIDKVPQAAAGWPLPRNASLAAIRGAGRRPRPRTGWPNTSGTFAAASKSPESDSNGGSATNRLLIKLRLGGRWFVQQ